MRLTFTHLERATSTERVIEHFKIDSIDIPGLPHGSEKYHRSCPGGT